jgi:hypothetical protein
MSAYLEPAIGIKPTTSSLLMRNSITELHGLMKVIGFGLPHHLQHLQQEVEQLLYGAANEN